MRLQSLLQILDRSYSFSKPKLLVTNFFLVLCLIVYLFFQNLSSDSLWMKIICFYTPLFLINALLYCMGIFLSVIQEEKENGKRIWVKASKKIGASLHLSLLPILLFLGIWLLLGVFYLLQSIPVLGFFFDVFLAFIPFLLGFFTVILLSYQLLLLFYFIKPIEEKRRGWVRATAFKIKKAPIEALFYPIMGFIPIGVFYFISKLSFGFIPYPSFLFPLYLTIRTFFLFLSILVISSVFVLGFFQFSFEVTGEKS